jgi:WD40 repeat protein/tRNA A-37 threonylcarbamoyl transferase component Bud32
MGAVFEAVDASGRAVALKLVSREGLRDEELRRRFEREGRAAAAIVHENVARCFGSGVSGNVPFIAFELLPGGSLRDRLKGSGRLSPHEAAAIGAQVARGLAAIHAAGLVHRDLKPENVLFDAQGAAKVSDLGLVRRADGAQSVDLTKTGETLGTTAYMAPEQIDRARSVDARADLYSLGCLLFALLTGEPPFQGPAIAVMKHHLMDAPPKPSASAPAVPPELDALVLRLLEKKPDARPQSADEVARALDAIASTGTGTRSRRSLAVVAIAAVALIGGAAVVFLKRSGKEPAPEPARPAAVATPARAPKHESPPPVAPERTRLVSRLGGYAWKFGRDLLCVDVSSDGTRALIGGVGGLQLVDLATGLEVSSFKYPKVLTRAVKFLDAQRAVAAGDDKLIQVFDLSGTSDLVTIAGHKERVTALALTSDRKRVFSASEDKTIGVSNLESMTWEKAIPCDVGRLRGLALSPDGQRVVVAGDEGSELRVVASGDRVAKLDDGPTRGVAITPEGAVVTGGVDKILRIWSLPDGKFDRKISSMHEEAITDVALSPDGRHAVTTSEDCTFKLWDLVHAPSKWTENHYEIVNAAVFADHGSKVVSVSMDGVVRLTETDTDKDLRTLGEGNRSIVSAIAVSPDGKRVLIGGRDRTIRLWDLEAKTDRPVPFEKSDRLIPAVAFSSDGKTAYAAVGDYVSVFDLANGRESTRLPGLANVWSLAIDGEHVLAGCSDGLIKELDPKDPVPVRQTNEEVTDPNRLSVFALALVGRDAVLAGEKEGAVKLWNRNLEKPKTVGNHNAKVTAVACDELGKHAVSASDDGTVRRWDIADRDQPHEVGGGAPLLGDIATISLKGDLVLSGREDGTLRLARFDTGEEIDRIDLGKSADWALVLAFAPDGKSFFVGTARGVVLGYEIVDERGR